MPPAASTNCSETQPCRSATSRAAERDCTPSTARTRFHSVFTVCGDRWSAAASRESDVSPCSTAAWSNSSSAGVKGHGLATGCGAQVPGPDPTVSGASVSGRRWAGVRSATRSARRSCCATASSGMSELMVGRLPSGEWGAAARLSGSARRGRSGSALCVRVGASSTGAGALRVVPVLKQPRGDTRDTRIPTGPPHVDAGAQAVYEFVLYDAVGGPLRIEDELAALLLGACDGDEGLAASPPFDHVGRDAVLVEAEVTRGRLEWGAEDGVLDSPGQRCTPPPVTWLRRSADRLDFCGLPTSPPDGGGPLNIMPMLGASDGASCPMSYRFCDSVSAPSEPDDQRRFAAHGTHSIIARQSPAARPADRPVKPHLTISTGASVLHTCV